MPLLFVHRNETGYNGAKKLAAAPKPRRCCGRNPGDRKACRPQERQHLGSSSTHSKTSLSAVGLRSDENGSKALADFLEVRTGRLLYHLAVPQEHEGRPELDLKRSAERFPFAILDRDVSDKWVTFE